jgi:DNA-binding transcriptional ArsR family regulator
MFPSAPLASTAFLIAEPARAAMLAALIDGHARPAGELAYAAGITAQTASAHLAKLLDGGLLTVQAQGRHRYYRLAGAEVAATLEQLGGLAPPGPIRQRPLGREARELRFARTCYDHLAGWLGVAVTQGLLARGYLLADAERHFAMTPAGAAWFAALGVAATPAPAARACVDWTERTHHLGGPLGVRLAACLSERGWLRRGSRSRSVQVTPAGIAGLRQELGVDATGAAARVPPP